MTQPSIARLAGDAAAAFSAAVLCVFPLYIDNFSNLGLVKYTGGFTLFAAFGLCFLACVALGARPVPGRFAPRQDPALYALGAWLGATALATLASLDPWASLWGLRGYYGGMTLALYPAAGYLAARAFVRPGDLAGLATGMGYTAGAICVLYALNVFAIDPIGSYENTAVSDLGQFFSTLGQMDFNASGLALLAPPVLCAFVCARRPAQTLLWGVPAALCALGLAVVNSEGLLLGIGTAALVFVCHRGFHTRHLGRMLLTVGMVFAWSGIIWALRRRFYHQGGVPLLGGLHSVALPGCAVCVALWALLAWRGRGRKPRPLYRQGRAATVLLLCAAVLLVTVVNLWPGFPSLGEKYDNLLRFNGAWGTYRGECWHAAWCAWASGGPRRWLLGYGPGMMHDAVALWAGQGMTPRLDTFYAAHNEYLEQLLTTGLPGLAAWAAFAALHLRRAARKLQRPGVLPVTMALASYLAQAAVGIRASMVFPLAMVLFGWLAALTAPAPPARAPAARGLPRRAAGARRAAAIAAAAVAAMAASGALSRTVFAFLY